MKGGGLHKQNKGHTPKHAPNTSNTHPTRTQRNTHPTRTKHTQRNTHTCMSLSNCVAARSSWSKGYSAPNRWATASPDTIASSWVLNNVYAPQYHVCCHEFKKESEREKKKKQKIATEYGMRSPSSRPRTQQPPPPPPPQRTCLPCMKRTQGTTKRK